MDKYIGIDVGDKQSVACVFEPISGQRDFQNLPTDVQVIGQWLRKQRRAQDRVYATYEVGIRAGFWYDQLKDCVDFLVVGNAAQMPWIYRTPKKNDRIDAEKQAKLLALGQLPAVHMPKADVRYWRQLIRHRQRLVQEVTRCKNSIRTFLKSQELYKPHRSNWWSVANRKWMFQVAQQSPREGWRMCLRDRLEQLALLEQQRDRVTQELDCYSAKYPGTALLRSIPGVGPRTAEAVLAYTDNVERFSRVKQYGAYFGLTPRLDESSQQRRLGHISKQGPSVVRWLLVEAAWRAVRQSPALKRYYERVRHGQPGRAKIAIVAVAHKLLRIMRAMLLSGEVYREQQV